MSQPGLTIRQAKVLGVVRDWIAHHGYPPSSREVGQLLGIAHNGAWEALGRLERAGCLCRDGAGGREAPRRTLRLARPTPGPARVHPASAVVAYQQGAPVGVAYRITPTTEHER